MNTAGLTRTERCDNITGQFSVVKRSIGSIEKHRCRTNWYTDEEEKRL